MLTRSTLTLPTLLLVSQLTNAAPTALAERFTGWSADAPSDSVGIERRDGRRYVLHRVDQGQTLFGVARRYRTSVDAIRAANPDLGGDGVRYEQLLRVPIGSAPLTRKEQREADKAARNEAKTTRGEDLGTRAAEPTPTKPRAERSPTTAEGTHLVETGQTLYSLAARYGVSMADLRRWNNLGADGIQVGQTIIVSEQAYSAKQPTGATASRATESSATRPATTPKAAKPAPAGTEVTKLEAKPLITPDPPLTPGSKPKPKTRPTPTTEPAEPARRAEPVADARPAERTQASERSERPTTPRATAPRSDNEPVATSAKPKPANTVNVLSEVGFADVIEGDNQSSKYLALHRSAPVGTLVQVRNDISNQSLYVKVVGKLPDTGLNDQVLIRLSNRAFAKLSPNGQRFRAEVSYAK